MSNIVVIAQDSEGLFIRKGSVKYRPTTSSEGGGLVRGKTTRAWTQAMHENASLTVDTPKGRFIWNKSE